MTSEELDKLQTLYDAATEGPWEQSTFQVKAPSMRVAHTGVTGLPINSAQHERDATFIVAACNATPKFIATVRTLQNNYAEANRVYDNCHKMREQQAEIERLTVQLHNAFKDLGTTLISCECGRGMRPSYKHCAVCEIERLRKALGQIKQQAVFSPESFGHGGILDISRRALGEE